jgi:c-di-GMP-binding flagellar brake protein YcgR
VHRSSRRSFLERLLSVAYIYPFRCQLCRHRFRAMQWGVRYVKPDRRKYERIPIRMPAAFLWHDRHADGVVTDLSVAGCTLETDTAIPAGEAVQLRFKAAGEDAEVSVDVTVVRSMGPKRVGLEFVQVREEQRERLARLVQDLLARMRQG